MTLQGDAGKSKPATSRRSRRRRIVLGIAGTALVALVTVLVVVPLAPTPEGPTAPPDDPSWPVLSIWDGQAPGNYGVARDETRIIDSSGWRDIVTIRDVFDPTLTVIEPEASVDTRAAMIVLPGGGFGGLAWDSEGTEIGQFLAKQGITAFVLKYRVQTPALWRTLPYLVGQVKAGTEPAIAAASADATQALHVVRDQAGDLGVDPDQVGMMGFSAGGITMLRVLQSSKPENRPNFAASIYGIAFDDPSLLRPKDTPLFAAAADPDPTVKDARQLASIWSEAGTDVDLQLFASGDHGFGLGRPGTDSERFASEFSDWLAATVR